MSCRILMFPVYPDALSAGDITSHELDWLMACDLTGVLDTVPLIDFDPGSVLLSL